MGGSEQQGRRVGGGLEHPVERTVQKKKNRKEAIHKVTRKQEIKQWV